MSRKRRNFGRELWDFARSKVQDDDGLPFYPCHQWTIDKLYFLSNYLAQMTQTMVGNPHFSSINYIDLFASSGVCALKDHPNRRYPGSSLLAALTEKPFANLFLVEKDESALNGLVLRLKNINATPIVRPFHGDCNEKVHDIISSIPPRSLNLAFIDPYSLNVRFSTIRALATAPCKIDLLILFADDMDLGRNVEAYYYPRKDSKLDEFLGKDVDWRKMWDSLEVRDAPRVRQLFADIYLDQLRLLGYGYSKTLPIPRTGRPLYRLIYASNNKLGLKFWEIAESEDLSGNRGLFGID